MTAAWYHEIERALGGVMMADRFPLHRRLRSLSQMAQRGQSVDNALNKLRRQIERSVTLRQQRVQLRPHLAYDPNLPIQAHRDNIISAIREHPVVIVCGETGSGKSTQLPKFCLELGRGIDGMIGHTQPRRLAARSIASRLAEELRSPLGHQVGYKIRFTDVTRPETLVKLMTDGILLAEIPSNRFLSQYDTIILDEAHERSLNIDFLLGYLKGLLPKRPELRLIVTSATIDAERFSQFFSTDDQPAPVIEVSGRGYPVETRYRMPEAPDEESESDTTDQMVAAVDELLRDQAGDILVFLPTERDIREATRALQGAAQRHGWSLDVLPLYARLPAKEQQRVFAAHRTRRVVLATNVAESSLTVPGIRAVIDTGTARISRYSPRSKVQRLPIEPVSRASADQRKGRCGRVGPGICVRLYSEEDYLSRDAYTTPEIRRTNLAAVILQTMVLKLGDIEQFPFLDPPRPESIRDGYKTLYELGAVDPGRKLTELGRQLSRMPVDPRVARMILAAEQENCLDEVLIIAAGLEVRDPRVRPADKSEAADARHAQFADERSDFCSILRLWDFYHHLKSTLSRNQLRRACRENYLSLNRLREWADIYRQLRKIVEERGRSLGPRRDDYDSIHRALLTGLLSAVAFRTDTHQYTGAGENRFFLWPGSALFDHRPKWIVAAELVETNRRYCRVVGRIDPAWIEPIADHLVTRSYSEPHWDRRSAAAMVFERVSLFGMPIVPRRRVPLARVDPETARQLFIQHALVEGELPGHFQFLDHNRRVLHDLEQRAARQRRSDWIVGQQAVFRFYDQRVPDHVCDPRRLKNWLRTAGRRDPALLHMKLNDLLADDAENSRREEFPDSLSVQQAVFPLEYAFTPGQQQDGVTVTLPRHAINQISGGQLDWLVPGRLEEKITALIRSLPKSIRRCLVPAPDTARKAAERLEFGKGSFLPALARVLQDLSGEHIPVDAFQLDRLPPHLVMKVRLVDDGGATLAIDDDLDRLRGQFETAAEGHQGHIVDDTWNQPATRRWDFGDLPDQVALVRGGMTVAAYPAIVDQEDAVTVRLADTPGRAAGETRRGVRRLYYLDQRKSLLAHVAWLPRLNEIKLLAATTVGSGQLETDLALLIADRAFLADESVPRTEREFQRRLADAADRAAGAVQDVASLIHPLFETCHAARLACEELPSNRFPDAAEDVHRQLEALVPDHFLVTTPWKWLQHFPRYFRAISYRLDKLCHGGQRRDNEGLAQLAPWLEHGRRCAEQHRLRGAIDPELVLFRWMLEEFRVSLFAQPLGTSLPVSAKRLEKQWAKVTQ